MSDDKSEEIVGHLEDEALKRKERLKALKQKKFNIENNISDSKNISDTNIIWHEKKKEIGRPHFQLIFLISWYQPEMIWWEKR